MVIAALSWASACSLFESFDGYSDDWQTGDASVAGSGSSGGVGGVAGWPQAGTGGTSGGGGAGGAGAAAGNDGGPSCGGGLSACGADCVDTETDADNCGSCGVVCAATLGALSECSGGSCTCQAGTTKCASGCTRTDSDPLNCGGCGKVVLAEKYCVSGAPVCRPRTNDCATWWYQSTYEIKCEFTCTDNTGDGSHCVKPAGGKVRCLNSKCIDGECSSAPCPADHIECPSTLTNTKSCFDKLRDSNHCGACSKQCKPDETCALGTCVKYKVAESCTECTAGMKCCDTPTVWAHPRICVSGSVCPT